jgi:hypothetical protein
MIVIIDNIASVFDIVDDLLAATSLSDISLWLSHGGLLLETTSDPVRSPCVPGQAVKRGDLYGRTKGAVATTMQAVRAGRH